MGVDEQKTALTMPLDLSAGRTTSTFRIVVEVGPEAGRQVDISGDLEVLVGQSPICALRLTDPAVSRRHLALEVDGTRLRVRDLGSTNETFIAGLSIREARLVGGERVRIGQTSLLVIAMGRDVESAPARHRFGEIVTESRSMARLFPVLERLAPSELPVLIEGETGTGKEVLARSIHAASARARGPLVVFDCAAVAASVVESELFGHERGAFTGAVNARRGLFEQAHGGTLFLDELGELPLDLQPKLLRAIERSEVRRVGGAGFVQCNVRVVAATRRNMDEMVHVGRFRDDLFHRLAVGRVELPPLRERPADIPLLVDLFVRQSGSEDARIPAHVLREWMTRPWPGNVRELRNAVFRYVTLGDLPEQVAAFAASPPVALDVDELSVPTLSSGTGESEVEAAVRQNLPYAPARERLLKTFDRRYVEELLARHGSVAKAARAAGLSTRYFQSLVGRASPSAATPAGEGPPRRR